jgi:hypothetical protein
MTNNKNSISSDVVQIVIFIYKHKSKYLISIPIFLLFILFFNSLIFVTRIEIPIKFHNIDVKKSSSLNKIERDLIKGFYIFAHNGIDRQDPTSKQNFLTHLKKKFNASNIKIISNIEHNSYVFRFEMPFFKKINNTDVNQFIILNEELINKYFNYYVNNYVLYRNKTEIDKAKLQGLLKIETFNNEKNYQIIDNNINYKFLIFLYLIIFIYISIYILVKNYFNDTK